MSVINQVLNQLERRGARTYPAQTMVRAVPKAVRNNRLYLLASILVLSFVGIGIWQWMQAHKPVVAAAGVARRSQSTAAANNNSSADKPVTSTTHQLVQAAMLGAPSAMPASRLSFELSPVEMRSTAKHETEQPHLQRKAAETLPHATVAPAGKTVKKKSGKIDRTPPVETIVAAPVADSAMPIKQISPAQLSDAEFRKASVLVQQGLVAEAMSGYEAALRLDAGNDAARQALVALLLEKKRGKDAERVLQEGLKIEPDQTGFTMMLARMQVERGAVAEATTTLEKTLPYADSRADYQAFLAALLQRQNRNEESVAHYRMALKLVPNNGIWLMGYGISLQALKRNDDARKAFQQALDSRTLNPGLQAFVRQKLKGL